MTTTTTEPTATPDAAASPGRTAAPAAATAPSATASPGTAAGPEAVIAGARERIDALDDRIIGLVQERMAVSAVVQQARIASGGRRVHLSREMDILGRYRDALGKPGTALAMTLLELCRGRI
ncbi:chorismate mutase [Streptomyces sp. SID486]|uniref:chorismate mutase n=1 Tax=Streptomyces sp. SID486 TaxID=2690264 RepID=UPI0013706644|nr:chorismate mutase [Streptomyces sp. SID486]